MTTKKTVIVYTYLFLAAFAFAVGFNMNANAVPGGCCVQMCDHPYEDYPSYEGCPDPIYGCRSTTCRDCMNPHTWLCPD